eukprot:TRINITY_DN14923_c0_g1_i1.p1 TRINITY_DN14923_c0_g1~~TRINITY_DN14923_c0_g1_i1.p1  ORF type:complete len:262 (+),score=-19.57 TRINITY_DN14923_c0_g1_i1:59-787(+)
MAETDEDEGLMGGIMGSLKVIELQLVAFILVFSAGGLVPLVDLLSPVVVSLYLLALARWAFPSYRKRSAGAGRVRSRPDRARRSTLYELYVMLGTTVGLFLPLSYVLGGFARGDREAVRCATPHLFLLSFEILSEHLMSSLSFFSAPVKALVPLMYGVRRVFLLLDWNQAIFERFKLPPQSARFQERAWVWFGRGLALANLVYFTLNLFCFLIPRLLPRSFERYFRERGEAAQEQNKGTKSE